MLPSLPQQSNFTPKAFTKFLEYGEWNIHLTELNSMENAILQNLNSALTSIQQLQSSVNSLSSITSTSIQASGQVSERVWWGS